MAKSSWCLPHDFVYFTTFEHEKCVYSDCTCECHGKKDEPAAKEKDVDTDAQS